MAPYYKKENKLCGSATEILALTSTCPRLSLRSWPSLLVLATLDHLVPDGVEAVQTAEVK